MPSDDKSADKPNITFQNLKRHGISYEPTIDGPTYGRSEEKQLPSHVNALLNTLLDFGSAFGSLAERDRAEMELDKAAYLQQIGQGYQEDNGIARWTLQPAVYAEKKVASTRVKDAKDELALKQISKRVEIAGHATELSRSAEATWTYFLHKNFFDDFVFMAKDHFKHEEENLLWNDQGKTPAVDREIPFPSRTAPKPDLTIGFPVHLSLDRFRDMTAKEHYGKVFSVDFLSQLRCPSPGTSELRFALTTGLAKVSKDANFSLRDLGDSDLICFPWAVVEAKRPKRPGDRRSPEERCYCQAANAAAAALNIFDSLIQKVVHVCPDEVPPVIAFTSVGPHLKVWLAFKQNDGQKMMKCIYATDLTLAFGVWSIQLIVEPNSLDREEASGSSPGGSSSRNTSLPEAPRTTHTVVEASMSAMETPVRRPDSQVRSDQRPKTHSQTRPATTKSPSQRTNFATWEQQSPPSTPSGSSSPLHMSTSDSSLSPEPFDDIPSLGSLGLHDAPDAEHDLSATSASTSELGPHPDREWSDWCYHVYEVDNTAIEFHEEDFETSDEESGDDDYEPSSHSDSDIDYMSDSDSDAAHMSDSTIEDPASSSETMQQGVLTENDLAALWENALMMSSGSVIAHTRDFEAMFDAMDEYALYEACKHFWIQYFMAPVDSALPEAHARMNSIQADINIGSQLSAYTPWVPGVTTASEINMVGRHALLGLLNHHKKAELRRLCTNIVASMSSPWCAQALMWQEFDADESWSNMGKEALEQLLLRNGCHKPEDMLS
ncbi:hypothetical protein LTR56_015858 [Elasticomyces elasticus]|nr:hypothetical protein LTR56_015858 [Elasticomyces elasticus]KAK4908210.1 hypothetical protein LTR49_022855 [Elasticomyces elasticus]KAK5754975.1 hypothetical protein LTS12_014891 [Elasticomyces elasticus]